MPGHKVGWWVCEVLTVASLPSHLASDTAAVDQPPPRPAGDKSWRSRVVLHELLSSGRMLDRRERTDPVG
jgi:hypothetical protein